MKTPSVRVGGAGDVIIEQHGRGPPVVIPPPCADLASVRCQVRWATAGVRILGPRVLELLEAGVRILVANGARSRVDQQRVFRVSP